MVFFLLLLLTLVAGGGACLNHTEILKTLAYSQFTLHAEPPPYCNVPPLQPRIQSIAASLVPPNPYTPPEFWTSGEVRDWIPIVTGKVVSDCRQRTRLSLLQSIKKHTKQEWM